MVTVTGTAKVAPDESVTTTSEFPDAVPDVTANEPGLVCDTVTIDVLCDDAEKVPRKFDRLAVIVTVCPGAVKESTDGFTANGPAEGAAVGVAPGDGDDVGVAVETGVGVTDGRGLGVALTLTA